MKRRARLEASVTKHAIKRLRKRVEPFKGVTDEQAIKILKLVAYLGQRQRRVSKRAQGNHQRYIRGKNLFNAGEDLIVVCANKGNQRWVVVTVYTYDFYITNRRRSRRGHRESHRLNKAGFYSQANKQKQEFKRPWK